MRFLSGSLAPRGLIVSGIFVSILIVAPRVISPVVFDFQISCARACSFFNQTIVFRIASRCCYFNDPSFVFFSCFPVRFLSGSLDPGGLISFGIFVSTLIVAPRVFCPVDFDFHISCARACSFCNQTIIVRIVFSCCYLNDPSFVFFSGLPVRFLLGSLDPRGLISCGIFVSILIVAPRVISPVDFDFHISCSRACSFSIKQSSSCCHGDGPSLVFVSV